MRLTLRTLLGYLDDILEPQQTRVIGEKLNESGMAATLVARIRDVLRRRRITAPEVIGPGSDPDPNVVAEYLDNTLPPEQVEDLERLCLESDIHLAEVAACHQILTLVLGEPVDIAPELRDRMYALEATPVEAGTPRASADAPNPVPPASDTATSREIPEYLRQNSRSRQWLPVLALLILLAVWLGLIFSDPAQSWRVWETDDAQSAPQLAQADLPAEEEAPPRQHEQRPADRVAAAIDPDAPVQRPVAPIVPPMPDPQEPDLSINPPPPADAPEPVDQSREMPAEPAPTPVEPVPPEAPPPAEAPDEPASAAVQPPAAEVAKDAEPAAVGLAVMYTANEGVLLRQVVLDNSAEWMVLPRRTLLHPGDQLANPVPFESELRLADSQSSVTLMGGTRLTMNRPQGPELIAMDVERGRVIFRRGQATEPDVPTTIGLMLYGTRYQVDLLESGTELGLEIRPHLSRGIADELAAPTFDGQFSLTAGAAILRRADGTTVSLQQGKGSLLILSGQPFDSPQPLTVPPEWMTPLTGPALTVARQYAHQFEDAFQIDQPVAATIPALVENRHLRISEFAAETMALTENVRQLVRALKAPHPEARRAAITGLGIWLAKDPARIAQLQDEVDRQFADNYVAPVVELVLGYPPEAARDPEVSTRLVEWLGSDQVSIRELAFFQIRRLIGDDLTYRYQPDAPEPQRRRSIRWWKEHIDREGALAPVQPDQPSTPAEVGSQS